MTTRALTASGLIAVTSWIKSSYSDSGLNCVEAAALTHTSYNAVAVRDAKNPGGSARLFASGAFAAFVTGMRTDRYGV